MFTADETSYGERLLRSPEAARAAAAIEAEVQQQLAAALHGPLAVALTTAAPPVAGAVAPSDVETAAAGRLLNTEVPRRFIAAGACLSAAYAALAEGEEARVAGALLCAQRFLFPDDPAGAAAVAQAVQNATLRPAAPDQAAALSLEGPEQLAALEQAVAAQSDALQRSFHASAGHVQAAALGSRSWLAATGGVGPGAVAGQTQFGPFLDGLLRWAFYTAAALQGLREDDWSRVGAALMAAQHSLRSS